MAALPETGISISLVKQTIGASSNDLGTLCIHPNVNIWAKYKPVTYPSPITDGISDWWKGQDKMCGIVHPYVANASQINSTTIYKHKSPIGGSNSPYRLGDFRGYDHNALPPCEVVFPDVIKGDSSVGNIITILYTDAANSLSLSDIFWQIDIQNWYFGVMLNDRGFTAFKTSSQKIGNGAIFAHPIGFELKGLYSDDIFITGNTEIRTFICDKPILETSSTPPSYIQIRVAPTNNQQFKIIPNTGVVPTPDFTIIMLNIRYIEISSTFLSGIFTIQNYGDKDLTFSSVPENMTYTLRIQNTKTGAITKFENKVFDFINPSNETIITDKETRDYYFEIEIPLGEIKYTADLWIYTIFYGKKVLVGHAENIQNI